MTYHAQACYKVRPIGCKLTPDPTMPSDQNRPQHPCRLFGRRRSLFGALSLGAFLFVLAGGAIAQTKPKDVSQLNKQLFIAVRADKDARVRSLLTAGADPVAVNAFGLTPAGLAIERGNFKMAHYILAVRNQRVLAKERAAERLRERAGLVPETSVPQTPAIEQEAPAAKREEPAAPQAASVPARQAQSPPPAAAAAMPNAAPPPLGQALTARSGRNPFDPLTSASAALPTLKITEATSAGQTLEPANENAQAASEPEPSEPGLLGRMVGGITDVFSSEEKARATAPEPVPATKVAAAPTPAPAKETAEVAKAVPTDNAKAAPARPAVKNNPVDSPKIQMRRIPKAAPQAASSPEPLQTARVSGPAPAAADEPGIFGRITGGISDGITSVFSSDPEPTKNKFNSEATPLAAPAKDQPQGETESGIFGRMMEGLANVVGAGSEETEAQEKTVEAAPEKMAKAAPEKAVEAESAPEKSGGDTTVISSFFKNIFTNGVSETEAKAEPKSQPKPEPEALVRSAPEAESPAPASKPGPKLPAVQVANAAPMKVEAAPPETKATLPETKAAPPKAKTAPVEVKAAPVKPASAPPKSAPFSAAGAATGPLPTISDPNLTASAKSPAPTNPAPAPAAEAEDEQTGLDKFLRRMFTESNFFEKRAPEEAPKEAPAPATEAIQSATTDGPSVETIAAAPMAAPKAAPGQSVSSKLDGFFKGLAKGFGGKSQPENTATTETAEAAAPPASASEVATAAPEPAKRSKLDRFVRGLFKAKPKTAEPDETKETAVTTEPPAPASEVAIAEPVQEPAKRSKLDRFVRGLFKAKPKSTEPDETTETAETTAPPAPAPAPKPGTPAPVAKSAPQADTKFTELASRPPTSRRRLGQGGGRRRIEAIPFIPAITLTVGETLSLGRTLSDAMSRAANCFQKGKNAGWYCLETADWPDEIRERLRVSTWIYRKARTIVHYRSGKAQRIFSVFPAKNFNRVVRFLEAKFGPPAEETDRSIALIGAPPKLNLTVKWKRKNADGSISVLEARKFDNVQRMVPDTKIGFIRLYREGSRPIFRTINESDLMLLNLRNSRISLNSGKK
jgi:hypothetical protein